jgi:hypothetical protein
MKLKDRQCFIVINRIRDVLLDSERDIGVGFGKKDFSKIIHQYSDEEVVYALRYLAGKGYLLQENQFDGLYKITSKGYDEWLFPNGPVNPRAIFISYATEDKELAGKIKECLEEIGYQAFLAHEDIEPTARWRDKIISDLKTCSIFIALRTENYIKKQYTEQECGFALAMNKRILSICINTKLSEMGFCSEFQGKKFEDKKEVFDYLKKQLGNINL